MLKYYEYTRHTLCEPLLTINIYKKVEDGKVIALTRISVYKNTSIVTYETDKLDGAEILELIPTAIDSLIKTIKKYYDSKFDDITVFGERQLVDSFLDKFYEEEE
ncbi:hypothetical protein [Sulfolobus acidocaldarius]|uniref:Conserved protein n=4 Tax=Sulfolobus acidocaldarius TaxID=2285 RepID=Q4JBN7_SULAC|nr:hypothetical protein [Sulfolobus acidocaldarius]AAY79792.1 conserved protein [Sulfolobus acidocaldarius DSM 639]AGE70350.1 hypothetical protein SacN8_01845 [Sulfolobus acidocaldarius N8]AGE72625.1 hypothetical protein SacRon12I_01845 [Sulfolobus acidocaldarius Ron12/I]ALU29251.1 hypothetical protein ATY89_04405 [Sulfolobus acidocaldarius]ALU31980.1 hypothetical protein ATZ20_07430 [Sulfolobus acidocaldarius]